MWLLDVSSFELKFFADDALPRYAILSHTWDSEEVSFQDMQMNRERSETKAGFSKIMNSCRQAREDKLGHIWIDTCCIDKSSSAELSEAINNMYRYYEKSTVCYVYFSDLEKPRVADYLSLEKCRWFTRGWTLQELLAPRQAVFYSKCWTRLGSKRSWADTSESRFLEKVGTASGIPVEVLRQSMGFWAYSIAQRMSWAAHRKTTRPEDMAYCLMGLFNVHMPIIYGEGLGKAFRRLQLEIMNRSSDQSLFAWKAEYIKSGILAGSPADFAHSGTVEWMIDDAITHSYSMTNMGLSIRMVLGDPESARTTARLNCTDQGKRLWIHLEKERISRGLGCYKRVDAWELEQSLEDDEWRAKNERDIFVTDPGRYLKLSGISEGSLAF